MKNACEKAATIGDRGCFFSLPGMSRIATRIAWNEQPRGLPRGIRDRNPQELRSRHPIP
jgi:hypothetical protein